jgi:hypothetical protein
MRIVLRSLIFLLMMHSCNQGEEKLKITKFLNKILIPSDIQWDTVPDGFGEGMDLLYKDFEIMYLTDSTINIITTNNEIDNDSILIVTVGSNLLSYKIKSISHNKIYFKKNNENDSICLNTEAMEVEINNKTFTVLNKICNESYIRLRRILNPRRVSTKVCHQRY